MSRRRRTRLATVPPSALALLLALAACSTRTPPPPGATGDLIYELQNCANCHGKALEGTHLGPPLADLPTHWSAERLARFLEQPARVLDEDARLRGLEQAYPGKMSRYDNLSHAQRMTLATWLLER